jgi:hypothetical protein
MDELTDMIDEYDQGRNVSTARKLELLRVMPKKGVRTPSIVIDYAKHCFPAADEEEGKLSILQARLYHHRKSKAKLSKRSHTHV